MKAPDRIKQLVEKFENNIKSYKSSNYNETTVRQEFIDVFFEELGWDVYNKNDAAPQYRDVIFEDSIKVGKGTKAPDYCFTLSGKKIFFVEAKKPAINIETDVKPSYQLRRYAWSAKLALSVLTDFEELAIYESKTRPLPKDRASIGRIKLYKFTDYVDKWEEIYNILSRDAVVKGSFDRFAETETKKGTSEVDSEFLKEIDNWRLKLARNIALRNSQITVEELNYAVQQTIDRIIFLRMAEDRGIEPYKQLLKLLDYENIYFSFGKLCKKADAKYNSGLFHFKEEKEINLAPDNLTLDLAIDNGIFKEIIKNLYYPKSPYEFSVLSPEILGNVYEQFLGKIIRLTEGHQAKVEEKTEVKKAGGVFYTPQYIVDYIVENTVGKLLENKTPKQIAKLRIVDPACGSGSFLLGAYTYLLKWHRDYYSKLDKKPKNTVYKSKNNEWHLTIQKKKEMLLNNIYGVDIDSQAVEVTKLSLLLKVLEDENKDVLEQQQKLFQERVLPFLGDNIRCGNSLIATDILDNQDLTHEEIAKINPFDWEDEFKDIFENGGFDAVIGNPPYGAKLSETEQFYLKNKYIKSSSETAIFFTKLAYDLLLKDYGKLGFIIPKSFTFASNYSFIRKYLLKYIDKIVDCKKVWKKVKLEQIMLFFTKFDEKNDYQSASLKNKIVQIKQDISKDNYDIFEIFLNDISKEELDLALKLRKTDIFVKDIANNSRGGMFQRKISNEGDKLVLGGAEIQREGVVGIKGKIDFEKIKDDKKCFINENSILVQRIIAHITKPVDYIKITACLPENRDYVIVDTINQITFNDEYDCKVFWALFNSKLINWYVYRFIFAKAIRTMQFDNPVTNRIPVYPNSFKGQGMLVKEVDRLFELYDELTNTKTPHEKKLLEKQIEATDKRIDKMVYELYGLNEDEIAIIENSLEK